MTLAIVGSLLLLTAASVAAAAPEAPVAWDPLTGSLRICEGGREVWNGRVIATGKANVAWSVESRPVESVYLGYPHGPKMAGGVPDGLMADTLVVTVRGVGLRVEGTVKAGADSLACLPDGGPEIVRGALGPSASALNRGVFDRRADWALWVPEPSACRVTPGKITSRTAAYSVVASGDEVKILLARHFLRCHRGYTRWDPAKKLWTKPVAGWCSWMAGGQDITEDAMLAAADMLAGDLAHYGYDVVQMDDGFQRFNQGEPAALKPGEGVPALWTQPNSRFPHGLAWLANEISKRGLTPGIWFSTSLPPGLPDEWYVKDPDGAAHRGPWINWAPNGFQKDAVKATYLDTFRDWKRQGWRYFKVDTLRHLLYDSYREVPGYWKERGLDGDAAFRNVVQSIKKEIGPDIYMLACWGTIPEAAGAADGCRIGEDVGPDWDSARRSVRYVAQFNYLNNIVWRNDPDYMCFRLPVEEGRAWASFIALTGSQLMVSDDPSAYDEPRRDILRRVAPPLFVRPTTLRPLGPEPELFALETQSAETPCLVLGRFAWSGEQPSRDIPFADLGLAADQRYLVFDFWNERLSGAFTGRFPAGALGMGRCSVWGIRPALDRPQLLGTSRHISQGAYELKDVAWKDGRLSGRMLLPPGRAFRLFIHVPTGWSVAEASSAAQRDGEVLSVPLSSEKGGYVPWSVSFTKG